MTPDQARGILMGLAYVNALRRLVEFASAEGIATEYV